MTTHRRWVDDIIYPDGTVGTMVPCEGSGMISLPKIYR